MLANMRQRFKLLKGIVSDRIIGLSNVKNDEEYENIVERNILLTLEIFQDL